MASNKIYANNQIKGEIPENYVPGKFHPVHLGDVLNDRYAVFRKLGAGSQSTVWLARDKSASKQRFVAIKVFGAKAGQTEIKLNTLLQPSTHPGKQHVELSLDTFKVHGPNGNHFCKVLEPLGCSLKDALDVAFEKRAELNEPEAWLGKVLEGDGWSAQLAKRGCWQILLGLDYLHSQGIAHRDIQPANVCVALDFETDELSENEIQKAVWGVEDGEGTERQKSVEAEEENHGGKNMGTMSEDDTFSNESSEYDDSAQREWRIAFDACKKLAEEQWKAFEAGDKLAEPHSVEWNKANFLASHNDIELLRRRDDKPLSPNEIHYTVASTPLDSTAHLSTSSRLVLVDLGFACSFNECEQHPLRNLSDFRPAELLLGLPTTHKADIFSLGLLFWEIVMLRRLVETRYAFPDPNSTYNKNRLLHDLVQRLGPLPANLRANWLDVEKYVDENGIALDMQEKDEEGNTRDPQEQGEEIYGPDDFEYGDIWHHARRRKPLDMRDDEMERFVKMVIGMLSWRAEERPGTGELLQHEWFKGIQEVFISD